MRAMSSKSGEENHCSDDTSNAPDSSTSEIFLFTSLRSVYSVQIGAIFVLILQVREGEGEGYMKFLAANLIVQIFFLVLCSLSPLTPPLCVYVRY